MFFSAILTVLILLMIVSGRRVHSLFLCFRKRGLCLGKYQDYERRTEELLAPIMERCQYELVDVEFVKEAGNWHLRAYIDKEGGITIDDLTEVNRELSDLLDREDFISESYILEVSSPGLLRPFKKPKDFVRNLGEDVEVKLFSPVTWEEDGKKFSDKEFVGVLKTYKEDEGIITLAMDENEMDFKIKDIALIRKYIEF